MYIYNICETVIHSHKNSLLTILFYISQLDKTQIFWLKAFNVNISVPPPTFSSIIYIDVIIIDLQNLPLFFFLSMPMDFITFLGLEI